MKFHTMVARVDNMKNRLIEYIKHAGISIREFERSIGSANGYVNGITGGISAERLHNINRLYPTLNTEWLLTGEGNMLNTSDDDPEKPQRMLPLLPFSAIAGVPGEDNEGVRLEDCELYAVPDFIDNGAQFLFRVAGDSMLPRYNHGDIVACRKLTEVTFLEWGKVYLLDTTQGVLLKRLYEDTTNANNVICHSENDSMYHDFQLPKSSIRSYSSIIGVIHFE